jgi:hypothetical protein
LPCKTMNPGVNRGLEEPAGGKVLMRKPLLFGSPWG